MSNRYEYPQFKAVGEVTNDNGRLEIVADPGTGSDHYLNIENIAFSVYEAAQGGGGKCRLQDSEGTVVYTINADGVKDVSLSFGDEGVKIGPAVGLEVIVYGAGSKQASVSVAVNGHISTR